MPESIFLSACFNNSVEQIPVWYMRQAGRSLPDYRKLKEKYDILSLCQTPELAAKVSLMPIDQLAVDAAILFADIMLPLIGMGVDLQIVEAVGPVISEPINGLEGVQKLKTLNDPASFDYLQSTIKILRGELAGRGKSAGGIPLIGFSGAPFTLAAYLIEGKPSRTFAKTKKLIHDQPQTWQQLMQILTDSIIFYLQLQIQAGVQAVQLFDSWAGVLSQADYVNFVLPYSKRIFSSLKQQGVPRIHFGTDTTAFLEEFAAVDCEVVGLDWRLPIAQGRRLIGPAKAVQGNLDPALLLCDFEVIKSEVDRVLSGHDPRQGFIFNLGHGVLPETPVENLIKLTEYVHSK